MCISNQKNNRPINNFVFYYKVMNLPKYPVVANTPYLYHFSSEGPQGRIKKAVIYAQIEDNLFNLAFGDWDEELKALQTESGSFFYVGRTMKHS